MAYTAQERYSQLVLAKLRAILVTRDNAVMNADYEGSPKAGAVKIYVNDTEVAVGDYDKASGLALGTGTNSYLTLSIDKDKGVNEIIDGYDAASVAPNIIAERLDSAAYSLQKKIDQDSITTIEQGGTLSTTVSALSSSTVYDSVVDAGKALDEANVPAEGRFLIVSPTVKSYILKDTTHFIRASALGDEFLKTGAIGEFLGNKVFVSNLMTKDSTTWVGGKTTTTEYILGSPKWCHRVMEFSVPVAVNNLSNQFIGSSAVQGRFVYGTKVSRATAVYVKTVQV